MAKVVGPLNSSEARGRVGAYIYNTWRGQSYVKSTKLPKTEFSTDQIALRLLTANATIAWKAASDADRARWLDYANQHPDQDWTGKPQRITAYNWFVRANVRRQLLALPVSVLPPAHQLAFAISDISVIWEDPYFLVNWGTPETYDPPTLYAEFYIVGPHSPGARPSVKMAKRRAAVEYDNGYWGWLVPELGYYTIYVRPVHSQGTVGIWYPLFCAATE